MGTGHDILVVPAERRRSYLPLTTGRLSHRCDKIDRLTRVLHSGFWLETQIQHKYSFVIEDPFEYAVAA